MLAVITFSILFLLIITLHTKFNRLQKYQNLYHRVYREVFDYSIENSRFDLLDEITIFDSTFSRLIIGNKSKRVKEHYREFVNRFGEYSESYKRIKRNNNIKKIFKL